MHQHELDFEFTAVYGFQLVERDGLLKKSHIKMVVLFREKPVFRFKFCAMSWYHGPDFFGSAILSPWKEGSMSGLGKDWAWQRAM